MFNMKTLLVLKIQKNDKLCQPKKLVMLFPTTISCNNHITVADPGFSRGGGVNPPGGAWTRQIFPKTAWNRKNLDAQGGACVPHAPPRSANALSVLSIMLTTLRMVLIHSPLCVLVHFKNEDKQDEISVCGVAYFQEACSFTNRCMVFIPI